MLRLFSLTLQGVGSHVCVCGGGGGDLGHYVNGSTVASFVTSGNHYQCPSMATP